MKRVATFTCLMLLTVGTAAAWAGICCPDDHAMEMQAADDCLIPAARVTQTTGAVDHSLAAPLPSLAAVTATDGPPPSGYRAALWTSELPPGGASPALSQNTPVLLR